MSPSDASPASAKVCSKDTVSDAGLNIWASGEDNGDPPNVDIIAVQGLGANPYYTWVKQPEKTKSFNRYRFWENDQTASDKAEVMWLRDFLPKLLPHARIATYSYKSDWRKANLKTSVRECGEQLLNVLLHQRTEKERPLLFIGHSLGGLIIKQALVLADHGNDYRDIRLSTAGIIFLGTPHQGSDAAVYASWLAQAARHDTRLLESLVKNNSVLHEIARDFEASYRNADIVCFYENKNASYGPWRTKVVDRQSASLDGKRAMFLTTDHPGLNKFRGPDDENFILLWPEIDRMVKEAPLKIKERYCSHVMGIERAHKRQCRRDDQEAQILATLASDYKSDKDRVSKRVSGTCEWFLEDSRFLEWRDSKNSRLLWVSAGPGCGKSVLARALIDERKVCTKTTASTVCYFFFKDGQEQRTSSANALSALLHQFLEDTDLFTYALDSYRSHGKELPKRFSELWKILVKSAEDSQAGEIICVLDALDECEENSGSQLIDTLVQFFSREHSCQNSSLRLKFLITSRPYDKLEQNFQRLSDVSTYVHFDGDEKSQMIGQEINLVIDAKIPYITGEFSVEDRAHISKHLKEMNNRTYLWLFLTIDIIENFPSNFSRKSDIHELLSSLPSEISDAYERILERSTNEVKARILLELIVTAARPLSLVEANIAMAIATRNDSCRSQKDLELWPVRRFGSTVKNWCGLFVSIHEGKLFLIHQTAREFLTSTSELDCNKSPKWRGRLDMAAAHGTMSRICLDYLNLQDIVSSYQIRPQTDYSHVDGFRQDWQVYDDMNLEYQLRVYAVNNWATHYNSQTAKLAKDSHKAAMRLCNRSSPQSRWFTIYGWPRNINYYGCWTDLGIASLLGLTHVAEEILKQGADLNARCTYDSSALVIASSAGHDHTVRMLIDNGAIDVDGAALRRASSRGHDQIVRMLLDNGAIDVIGEALKMASLYGHDQTVRMLLDNGAIDVTGEALEMASLYGHDQTVRILLDNGAINVEGGALSMASLRGHDQIVRMLIDNGVIDVTGGALKMASLYGHDQIVRILLDKGGDFYAQGGTCSDALGLAMECASDQCHDQVVKILREFKQSAE